MAVSEPRGRRGLLILSPHLEKGPSNKVVAVGFAFQKCPMTEEAGL
jgi:hypothetical protein